MIDNHELPISFTMELAQHSDILNVLRPCLMKSRSVISFDSRGGEQTGNEEYVENMFRG